WPSQGYECQVNATQKDWRKTGSIYSFQDLKEPGHKDDEWFTYNIKVEGKKITVTINGKVVNEYTEPANHKEATKRLSEGTIALQGHDPGSLVYFRKLRIKTLK
ncbi:MAG: 3-keto-disaccharide hydrolase, partial [Akkermansiaceae bacterium]